jgi:hypothetical protein
MKKTPIEERVAKSADALLNSQGYVTPIEILMGAGFLQYSHVNNWRKGIIQHVEKTIQAKPETINETMESFQSWAREKRLRSAQAAQLLRTKGPRTELQFSESGNPEVEKLYRTYYISSELTDKQVENIKEKLEKAPQLSAFIISKDAECSGCKTTMHRSSFIYMEAGQPFCMKCAGFDDLVYIPSGNAKLTRTATKNSDICLIVVKWSSARKRYERQGILVEEAAYEEATKG